MGLGKLQAFLMGVFGGAVSGQGATTGQALVKQANGSWAPGTVGGGVTVTASEAFILGAATTAGVRLDLEGGVLAVREGDDSAYAGLIVDAMNIGAGGLSMPDGQVNAYGFVAMNDGLLGAPAFRSADNDNGMYFPATDTLALVANNAIKMYIDDTLGVQGLGVQLSGYKKVQINQTADATLSASDPDIIHTNIGASGAVNLTLPSSPSGISGNSCIYHAVVGANQYLRFTATTGVTIRDGATVSATAGYIRSTTVGSTLTLLGISATEWVVFSKTGTWTIDS